MGVITKSRDIYSRLKGNVDNQANVNYGYGEMSGVLDELYDNSRTNINRQSAYDTGRAKQGAAARNAGITGSLKEDIVGKAGANVTRGKYDALGKLESGRLGSSLTAMEMDNRNVLNQQQLQNQALSQLAQFFPQLMAMENQPGTLEDIFAVLNTGANVADAIIPG